MRNYIYIFLFISITILSCKEKYNTKKTLNSEEVVKKNTQFFEVISDAETTPVTSSDDAADDACIWINSKDILQSTIIGTNKREGLEVYDLDGKRLYSYPIGRVNNVDIRSGFLLNGKEVSVVTTTNRTTNTIDILYVKPTGELEEVSGRPIKSNMEKVYGLGMYKSHKTNLFYVFIVGKEGEVEQWELFESKAKIDAKLVRNFELGSQGEGIVADDFHGNIYIGEEDNALWKYDAEPNASNKRVKVISVAEQNMKDDFEGVTLYDSGNGTGQIILSSQGNNSYAVFDRITNNYKGSFKIKNTKNIDGTDDTDGIDVTSISFGNKYPKGFFIAQDGANTEGKDSLNQNFKIVDWQKIAKKLDLK